MQQLTLGVKTFFQFSNTNAVLLRHMINPKNPLALKHTIAAIEQAIRGCCDSIEPFVALPPLKNVMRVGYLLGVKANLCLHNSQYSFLLCLSHCTKL